MPRYSCMPQTSIRPSANIADCGERHLPLGTRNVMHRTTLFRTLTTAMLMLTWSMARAQTDPVANADSIFPKALSLYQPLSEKERWHIYFHDNFESPGAYFRAFGASIGEHYPTNPPTWPSGAAGYFADVGSQFGRFTIDGTIDASMAAAFRYDPRYLACNCHGAFRRTGHAILRTFITYDRDGHRVPDLPGLSGIYGGSMLMMYWYPKGYSPLTTGVQVGNFSLGVQCVVNIVKEFAPDIKRFVRRKGNARQ